MRITRYLVAILALLALVLAAAPAQAQDPERPLEMNLGYVFANSGGEGSVSYPLGFNAGLSRDLKREATRTLAAGVEFRWSYRRDNGFSERQSSIFGGPRFTFTSHSLRPYVRPVVGVTWWRWSFGGQGFSESDAMFGVQAGIRLGNRGEDESQPTVGFSLFKRSYWGAEVNAGFDPFCPLCWLKTS